MAQLIMWSIYTEHARTLNMLLLCGVVAGLTANMIVRRQKTIRRTRRIGLWLFLFMLNAVYGYSITIRDHRAYNRSVGIATAILLGAIISIIWHPKGDNNVPPHDGSLTSRFMVWLDAKVRAYKTRHRKLED